MAADELIKDRRFSQRNGTILVDLRRTLGAEWDRLAWVPFALIERGAASTTAPQPGTSD